MKTCTKCKEEMSLDLFQLRKTSKDGRSVVCKACLATRQREYSKGVGSEVVRAFEKRRSQNPQRKIQHNIAVAGWIARNKKRRKAQVKLNNNVMRGKIFPQPCFLCGNAAEAHHPDYDRPLDVVWLCKMHHTEVHSQARSMDSGLGASV